jgi:excisionase family DNA binding protein
VSADDHLLTVDEVAERLRKDPSTVRRWIRDGLLEAESHAGGPYRVTEDALVRFREASRVRTTPPAPRRSRPSPPSMPSPPRGRAPGGSFRDRSRTA